MHLYRHSCLGSGFSKASGQDGCHAFQLAADIVSAHVGKVDDTGCHSQRVAAQSAGLIHGANRSNLFHDLAFTAVSGYRQPAADNFAQTGDIRINAVEALRRFFTAAEARHDFITDKQCSIFFCDGANEFQIAVLR